MFVLRYYCITYFVCTVFVPYHYCITLLDLYCICTVSILYLYCIAAVFVLYHYCIGLLIVCTVLVLYHNGVYALLNHLWFWSLYRSSPLVLHRCCRCIRIRLVLLGSRRRHFIYLYTARRRLKVERWPKSTTSCRSESSNISLVVQCHDTWGNDI